MKKLTLFALLFVINCSDIKSGYEIPGFVVYIPSDVTKYNQRIAAHFDVKISELEKITFFHGDSDAIDEACGDSPGLGPIACAQPTIMEIYIPTYDKEECKTIIHEMIHVALHIKGVKDNHKDPAFHDIQSNFCY